MKKGVIGVLGLIAFVVLWGLIEPYVLEVKTEAATVPNLPEAWEGKRIGQVSDFQLGMWMHNIGAARRSIEYLVEENPAAVVVSGDFIYKSLPNADVEIGKAVSVLQPLIEADIPTYAVLGNHDYSHKPPNEALGQQVKTTLEENGIRVLQNEAIALESPQDDASQTENTAAQPLYLVGVGSLVANHDQVDQALSQLDTSSPRIVLMHNPGSFGKLPAESQQFSV